MHFYVTSLGILRTRFASPGGGSFREAQCYQTHFAFWMLLLETVLAISITSEEKSQ
jgi:hypothetical protein